LLRITAPGVPDTYQGTELWDLSLVDPDNRRPVDYTCRLQLLRDLDERLIKAGADRRAVVRELLDTKDDGRIKLYCVSQALRLRRDNPGLFSGGDYLPLEPVGAMKDHLFGFVRRLGDKLAVAVVPRLLTSLVLDQNALPLGNATWGDATVLLPEQVGPRRWRNIFTGAELQDLEREGQRSLRLSDLFADFPIALLVN
jgi:(1->4)-alpha-D-glucan 1-alpha-D-glucosylmutase